MPCCGVWLWRACLLLVLATALSNGQLDEHERFVPRCIVSARSWGSVGTWGPAVYALVMEHACILNLEVPVEVYEGLLSWDDAGVDKEHVAKLLEAIEVSEERRSRTDPMLLVVTPRFAVHDPHSRYDAFPSSLDVLDNFMRTWPDPTCKVRGLVNSHDVRAQIAPVEEVANSGGAVEDHDDEARRGHDRDRLFIDFYETFDGHHEWEDELVDDWATAAFEEALLAIPSKSLDDAVPRTYPLDDLEMLDAFEADFERTRLHALDCAPRNPADVNNVDVDGPCPYRQELVEQFMHVPFIKAPQPRIDREHNLWVLKPISATHGDGIYVIDSLDHEAYLNAKQWLGAFVVQKYVENSILSRGRKFDLRLQLLVASRDPLVVYLNDWGGMRTSLTKYYAGDTEDVFGHITNYHLQEVIASDDTEMESVLRFEEAAEVLASEYGFGIETWKTVIMPRIRRLLARVMFLFTSTYHRDNSFELVGVDLILDDTWQPWLLEINTNIGIFGPYEHLVELWSGIAGIMLNGMWKDELLSRELDEFGHHVEEQFENDSCFAGPECIQNQFHFLICTGQRRPPPAVTFFNQHRKELEATEWTKASELRRAWGPHFPRYFSDVHLQTEEERIRRALEHIRTR